MKTAPAKAKLRKGLAVGSVMLVGASIAESAKGSTDLSGAMQAVMPESALKHAGEGHISAAVTIPIRIANEDPKWHKSDATKLRNLAIKRARRTISQDENKQFEILQRRRRANVQVSPEEVLSEWRRRRFVGELLQVLDRNVHFFKAEDKARIRSIREAASA